MIDGGDIEIDKGKLGIEEAYEIQSINQKKISSIAGWKLGGTNQATCNAFSVENAYWGPVFSANVHHIENSGAITLEDKAINGEVEITVELSGDFQHNPSCISDVENYISNLFLSVEMPVSRLKLPADGLAALIADQCASGYLILGVKLPINTKYLDVPILVLAGEKEIASGNTNWLINGLEDTLKEFLSLSMERGSRVESGALIATGGLTPCIRLPQNKLITVKFGDITNMEFILGNKSD